MYALGLVMYGMFIFTQVHTPVLIMMNMFTNSEHVQAQEREIDSDEITDAMMIIDHLLLVHEDSVFEKLPENTAKQNLRPECQITQPPVEELIKSYALTHEKEISVKSMKRVADAMSKAIGYYADVNGNDDGSVTLEEIENFLRGEEVIKNNGMFFLLCFIEAYE